MEKTAIAFFFIILALTFSRQIWGAEESQTKSPSNVLAQLLNVRSRTDNQWMVAVKKGKNWDVKIKQAIPKEETLNDIFIHMYTRDSPKSFQQSLFESSLCSVLTDHSKSRFFPKDIIDMILPGEDNCEIKKRTVQIQSARCVSTEFEQNPGILFPTSKPYELIVDFLSKKLPDDRRFFRVNLMVGNKTGCEYGETSNDNENGKSENKCQNTWKIVKPVCTVAQTVSKGISGIVKSIKNIF